MQTDSTRLLRSLRALPIAIAIIGFGATNALASPVTYQLTEGHLDAVFLQSLSGGVAVPCPPFQAEPVSCLASPVMIDSASIMLEGSTVLEISISLSGTGEVLLAGFNGYHSATFTGTTIHSVGQGDIANLFSDVSVTDMELFMPGDPPINSGYVGGIDSIFSQLANSSLVLNGNQLEINLNGINIAGFVDPLNAQNTVMVTANFTLLATAVPEPTAAILFIVTFGVMLHVARRSTGTLRSE